MPEMILGFDPGKDKCGVAVMEKERTLHYHQVIESRDVLNSLNALCQKFPINLCVMGNQTTSKSWKQKLLSALPETVQIIQVDERYSSLEARDRYWQMYPPQGLTRLVPQGMRTPPRPIDDIVAIILIERYLSSQSTGL